VVEVEPASETPCFIKNYARDKSKKRSLCQCTEFCLYFSTRLEQLGTKDERMNWHLVAAVATFATSFQLPFFAIGKLNSIRDTGLYMSYLGID